MVNERLPAWEPYVQKESEKSAKRGALATRRFLGNGRVRVSRMYVPLKILGSATHFVEIDLLRQGNPMPMVGQNQSHYRIVVSQSENRPKAKLYEFNLQDGVPEFSVPLRAGEPEPIINLKLLLDEIYDQGSYDLRINYSRPPIPALSEPDMAWANERMQQQELR